VLKALGFRAGSLVAAVLAEAAAITVLAVPVGIAVAQVLALLIGRAVPLYVVLPLEPAVLARTVLAAAVFAALGAVAPVRAIARIEPARVFRS
jgi:ABC-type antimicrobial peptide transport system permease subunit